MTFDDPVVAGTTLIRAAIRSPNYVPGVAGWTINRDGTAEFLNVLVRGEVFVQDPDGSYVRIFDENPGSGAVIELQPADVPGFVFTPGSIITDAGPTFTQIVIGGPGGVPGSYTSPQIFLGLSDIAGTPYSDLVVRADQIAFETASGDPPEISIGVPHRLLGFEAASVEGINSGAAFSTTSGTYVTVTGAPTLSFTKAHDDTRVRIDHHMTMQADAAGT